MAKPPAHSHAHGIGAVRPVNWAFPRAPMIVYWELTNACGLACRHCRATAMPDPAPGELSTDQAIALLDEVARFGDPLPHMVFTGGDPLRRHDLKLLMAEAAARGIGVSLAPAVTPLLTREKLAEVKADGVQAISLSLDGSCPDKHDGVRGVAGTFDATMEALGWAEELDIPVQINTLVTSVTATDLPAIYELLSTRKLLRWSLFFLISIGRGTQLVEMTPGDAEKLMVWLNSLTRTAPFLVRTTEATHYRRIAARSLQQRGMTNEQIEDSPMARGFGIRDGNGIVFVSNTGDVTPSGFLPLPLGNVKDDSLVELYRHHPTMVALREPEGFKGRCGWCEYNRWCGGSRARAYAWTGDVLESDPLCPYVPKHPAEAGSPSAHLVGS
ncbi:MAG: TIGR04053 family radical SAM/SPASM domain-containing protein [Propionicimonas sp.]